MKLMRRVLYWEAAVWALAGVALGAFPRIVLVKVFDQIQLPENAWVRIVGVQAVTLALLMVLVAQRIERLWWWAWTFVLGTAGIATVAVLNATLSLPKGSSAGLWWGLVALTVLLTAGLLWGMAVAGNEGPADLTE